MRVRKTLFALLLCTAGSSACTKKSPAPPPPPPTTHPTQPTVDTAPASLGPNGIVVEQPVSGDTLEGTWVTVAGWVDPKRWSTVLVTGAPADRFYRPNTGHMGVATVPVLVRADGRFVAPRVPLKEGQTEIDVIPLGPVASRAPPESIRLMVTGHNTTSTPATAVATPSSGPAPLATSLQAFATADNLDWEWDFDGDGTFDAVAPGGAAIAHTYDTAGSHLALARVKQSGRWTYAVTAVTVTAEPQVLDQTTVGDPRSVSAVVDYSAWSAALTDEGLADHGDDTLFTKAVLVSDGDAVKVFDAHLGPKLTLTGLSHPAGAAGDLAGHFYVADTGNNRIVRFNADGSLDHTFGVDGGLATVGDGGAFSGPTSLAVGYSGSWEAPAASLLVLDHGNDRLVLCSDEPMHCAPVSAQAALDDAPASAPTGLASLGAVEGPGSILYAESGGLFPAVLSDNTRILGWSMGAGRNNFDAVGTPGKPMLAVSALPTRELRGLRLIAGADAAGVIHEWIAGSSHTREVRQEHLPYAVHALAFDSYASAFRAQAWRSGPGAHPGLESGPVVIYVAGPGHLERRVLSSVEVLPW